MSLYRQIVVRFWPLNTIRGAYLRWEALDSRLIEARQHLARQYLASRRQAEEVQIETRQGVLRAAESMLHQPQDPMLLMAKARLQKAFAWQGQGFLRRVPPPLEVELTHYAAGVEKICRTQGELGSRLRLSQKIIRLFDRHPEFCQAHFFRLALISPESAWLCFHLRQKRLQDRRAIQNYL
jgi:hypothetical protein